MPKTTRIFFGPTEVKLKTYEIRGHRSGLLLGTHTALSEKGALDAYARSMRFNNLAEAVRWMGPAAAAVDVEEIK
jgi:hypothetical protein